MAILVGQYAFDLMLKAQIGDPGVSKLAGSAVALLVVAPLNTRIRSWVDERIGGSCRELADKLPKWIEASRDTESVTAIAEGVARRIKDALEPSVVAVVVDGRVEAAAAAGIGRGAAPLHDAAEPKQRVADWLASSCPAGEIDPLKLPGGDELIALRLPLAVESDSAAKPLGWLQVGPRTGGGDYAPDEVEALTALAPILARAILLVQRREERDAQLAALSSRLGPSRDNG